MRHFQFRDVPHAIRGLAAAHRQTPLNGTSFAFTITDPCAWRFPLHPDVVALLDATWCEPFKAVSRDGADAPVHGVEAGVNRTFPVRLYTAAGGGLDRLMSHPRFGQEFSYFARWCGRRQDGPGWDAIGYFLRSLGGRYGCGPWYTFPTFTVERAYRGAKRREQPRANTMHGFFCISQVAFVPRKQRDALVVRCAVTWRSAALSRWSGNILGLEAMAAALGREIERQHQVRATFHLEGYAATTYADVTPAATQHLLAPRGDSVERLAALEALAAPKSALGAPGPAEGGRDPTWKDLG